MSTITTGVFFLTRQGAEASTTPDGTFKLVLHAIDRQGDRAAEAYELHWSGEPARTWWAEHKHIPVGQPLAVTVENPRSFPGLRSTHTKARVLSCALAPVAPSWANKPGTQPQARPA